MRKQSMIPYLALSTVLVLALTIDVAAQALSASGATAVVIKDPQALSLIQASLSVTGASAAVAIQDSLATGTLTWNASNGPLVMPIVLKTKGTRKVRVELQKPKGTSVRIVNNGVGVLEQPDRTLRWLLMNNTLVERVGHIPALSLLADFQDPTVSVENWGSAPVSKLSANVVALHPLIDPNISQAEWDRSLTKTAFYFDPASGIVVKFAYNNFTENDSNSSQLVEVYLSDYKPIDGILVPMHQTTYADGELETDMVLNSVVFNIGLADSEFAIPDVAAQ